MQEDRKKYYESLIQAKYNKLKDLYPLDPKNDWKFYKETHNVTIHVKKDKQKGINIVRGEGLISVSLSQLIEQMHKIEEYVLWDKTLEAAQHIETIDEYVVAYARVIKVPAVSARESLQVNRFFYEPNGSVIGVGASVEHPTCPITKHAVRVNVCLMGWIFIPDQKDVHKTTAIYVMQVDPKGWVPKSLYNLFCFVQALNVNRLRRYLMEKLSLKNKNEEDAVLRKTDFKGDEKYIKEEILYLEGDQVEAERGTKEKPGEGINNNKLEHSRSENKIEGILKEEKIGRIEVKQKYLSTLNIEKLETSDSLTKEKAELSQTGSKPELEELLEEGAQVQVDSN